MGLLFLFTVVATPAQAEPKTATAADPIDQAFGRLYNFDFAKAHKILDGYNAGNPSDPLDDAVRAAVYLFSELDRLMILESEFFLDNSRIREKKKLKADPVLKRRLLEAVERAQRKAENILAAQPTDRRALFALCMTTGILTDYMAFVEKKQLGSLSYARQSQVYALRLIEAHPKFYDAYLTTGLSEYLIGSLPFFIRWFVRFDQVEGSKKLAVQNLELVAREGRYLGPFAKILLAVIHLREKRPEESEKLLADLSRAYPENPLFRKELGKLRIRLNH